MGMTFMTPHSVRHKMIPSIKHAKGCGFQNI